MLYDLLPIEPDKGLNRLPTPSKGDLYFDIEGDHFFEDGGIEYLLGLAFLNDEDELVYHAYWGLDRRREKLAFEQFIDVVMERWDKYPDFYIYHYAPYEPTAVKRLAARHGTREIEVDQLLRVERFVDLFQVIRETLQASVESYSLKKLEGFTDYIRAIDLFKAASARRSLGSALELNAISLLPKDTLQIVEDYNKDDCLATQALHSWIENIFQEQMQVELALNRPEIKTGDATEAMEEREGAVQEIYDDLTVDVPEDPDERNDEHSAKWLLANQLEFFRRESRSAWWEYFYIHSMDLDDLLDEKKGISGLEFIETVGGTDRCPIHRYEYPPQEISLDTGSELHEIMGDKVGILSEISLEESTVDIRKASKAADIHPSAVHVKDIVHAGVLATSLQSFAQTVVEVGLENDGPFQAGRHLLLRKSPTLANDESLDQNPNESLGEAAVRIASNLDNSYFPIQGPPGTGKTYIGAQMIIELYLLDKRIGVTAVSHKVIRNLLEKVLEIAKERAIPIEVVHKVGSVSEDLPDGLIEVSTNAAALESLEDDFVVGGTSWLWAREEMVESLDFLFVDEAGQMSLANVLSTSRATKNLILLGDPQQLEQPQKGAHPEGTDIAALNYIIGNRQTISSDKGLFLDETWRLNPAICSYTSEMFYENRVKTRDGLERQVLTGTSDFAGGGLFYVPVEHTGNQNRSFEEVAAIRKIVEELTTSRMTWTDRDNNTLEITSDHFLIVAPFNAQVSALTESLPTLNIGTVDKFQGQEAPVVIYTMTSSSAEDAPRGMSFLYNLNRLNVATSRAQCCSILVASPRILEPECHTVDQMKWANALCRFREMAKVVG